MQDDAKLSLNGISLPGRGIVIGLTSENRPFCAYFLTARTENSQGRRLVPSQSGVVSVIPSKEMHIDDDNIENLFYNAIVHYNNIVALGSGKHTDTIIALSLQGIHSMESVTRQWCYEKTPEHAPRISGRLILPKGPKEHAEGTLGLIRLEDGTHLVRESYSCFDSTTGGPGTGSCITTYKGIRGGLPELFDLSPLEMELASVDARGLCREIGSMIKPKVRVGIAAMVFTQHSDSERFSADSHITNYSDRRE